MAVDMSEVRGVPSKPGMAMDLSPRCLLIGLLLLLSSLYYLMARESYQYDFRCYYLAAQTTHDHLDPYLNHVDLDEKYADGMWLRPNSRFVYPPTAIFFIYPFLAFSYGPAKLAFGMTMVLLMVGLMVYWHERYPGLMPVILALFLSLPMLANIDCGQIDILMLALIMAAFYLDDGWLGGVCLGLAIALKAAPILCVAWFLLDKRWRTSVWSLVTSGALTGVAVGLWGVGRYKEFLHQLLTSGHWDGTKLEHVFEGVKVTAQKFIVVGNATYAYGHTWYGGPQNPLQPLGHLVPVVGLTLLGAYTFWIMKTDRGRSLTKSASFFGFLVVALFVNSLLWTMGLILCFPLVLELVNGSKTPIRTALILLTSLFLPFPAVIERRFLVWVIALGICLWLELRGKRETLSVVAA
jgi:Glycosyltransferase family 87